MPNLLRRAGAACATIALVAANACYAYLPVDNTAPPPGRVRVMLNPDGSRELTRLLGPGVTVAEGVVSTLESDGTLRLGVDYVQFANGMRTPWTGEGVVPIAVSHRDSVLRHTYQRRQSVMAAGALVAALVATAVLALRTGGSDGGEVGGPPPPPALVPR
jgi:hypothetical protein